MKGIIIVYAFLLNFTCFYCNAQNQTVINGKQTQPVTFSGTCTYNWINDNPAIGLPANGTGNIAAFTAKNTGTTPLVATITATPNFSGTAYIANNYISSVSVVDLATNTVIKDIPVGMWPITTWTCPKTSRVYVSNSASGSISVIDAVSNTVVATINVGSYPFGLCASADGQRAYVANYNDNNISVIDAGTNKVIAKWASGPSPIAVATSPDGTRLYAVNSDIHNNGPGTVTVINTADGTIVSRVTVGVQPWGIAVSNDGKFFYVTNPNEATVSVIDAVGNAVVAKIPVGAFPRMVAVSPDGLLLYVRDNDKLLVIRISDKVVLARIPMGGVGSAGICVSPDGSRVLAISQLNSMLTVINGTTNTVITNVAIPGDESVGFGNIIMSGYNCAPATFKITVNPSPIISTTGNLQPMSTTYGQASASQSFTVKGTWLSSGITATVPVGFEISLDNTNFNSSVVVSDVAGAINSATLYIRLTQFATVKNYAGDIVISSPGATDSKISIPLSTVNPATVTIKADDKDRFAGTPNPALTATYNGFVNTETNAVLTTMPVITTVADINSAPGQYPITVNGATADNYIFDYEAGILTVNPDTRNLVIPNTFTPNGDGINDTWNIQNLNGSTAVTVEVFNRAGGEIFYSIGYGTPWDGKYKGVNVPYGTYYYVIKNVKNNTVFSGFVLVIR